MLEVERLTDQRTGQRLAGTPESVSMEPSLRSTPTSVDGFDPGPYFDRWLVEVRAIDPLACSEAGEIYLESARGSSCEVNFDGVLHFDGYTLGNIRSLEGTLVLGKEGRVDADIHVGKAVISGSVTGNINAPEGVVLDSDARVAGQIHTRMLSVRVGAMFEGDCLFVSAGGAGDIEKSTGIEWLDRR